MKTLFNGQLDFDNADDLDLMINHLNQPLSIKLIEMGLETALNKGVFNLIESHCLYKSLHFLKNYENENKDTNIHSNDTDGDTN